MSVSPPHFEDSLDNLSGLQNNKNRQLVARVKQSFAQGLQKLQSAETREVGISELRRLIDAHREPEHLRSYIAILKGLKPNSSSATKEHEVLVVSILAQTCRDGLLDPLDKPPSLLKTCLRLVELLHGYFSDRSPTVQQACARALLDLTAHCLAGQGAEAVFAIIYSPLISILKSGVDKGSQGTAAACLHELILYSRKVADSATLARLAPDLLAVFLRVNCEYHELFQAVHSLLEALGLSFLEGRVVAFLAKLLPVIAGTREAANSSNFNSYMCKVGVCKIVERIGSLLPMSEKAKLADLSVVESLQQAARHRIMQVQLAAARALKAWKEERDESPKSHGLTSLQEKRASKQKERSKSKEEREKMENELTFMKEDLEKLVKGGWGASNRARNFVRQGSGVGGGYHGRMNPSPPNRSGSKSHKEHLDELRDHIKKGIEENRNIDRFASAQLPRSQTPPQRPAKSPQRVGQKQEMEEFGLEVEEGEQMVYDARSEKQVRPKKSFLEEAGISAEEAKDLMKHEDSLMHDARNMNINFNTAQSEKSRHSRQSTPSQKSYSQRQQQSWQQQSEQPSQPSQRQPQPPIPPNQIQPMQIPLIPNEVKPRETPKAKEVKAEQGRKPTESDKPNPTVKPTRDKSEFVRLSHEELGELVEEYNLSQVSSNLEGVLNESDLHMIESSRLPMMDSAVIEPEQGKSEIETFKDIIGEKRNRKSIVSKFFKKEQQPQPENPSPKPPSLSPEPNVSLNFTESAASRAVGKREEAQFTLNPKDRFSSLAPRLPEENAEIEEDIAMSEYEESLPKGHPLPTYPPRLPQSSQFQPSQAPSNQCQPQRDPQPQPPQRQPIQVPPTPKPSPEEQADFQSLIKNPPKLLVIEPSQPSHSQPSEVREVEEGSDLGEEWRHVVSLLREGEMEEAFESGLALDDPIYLLRLLLISKCPLKKLTADTTRTLWRQFLDIYSRRFIDVLALGLFAEAHELSLLPKCLSVEELQELLLGLYQLSGTSKGKLSYRSATLYNEIETSLRSGRSQ